MHMKNQVTIREALANDFDAVVALDLDGVTEEKPTYWRGIFDRYVTIDRDGGFFLVAEIRGEVVGFIVGEIRAWEFGSPPCGWVFALSVSTEHREMVLVKSCCKRCVNVLRRLELRPYERW